MVGDVGAFLNGHDAASPAGCRVGEEAERRRGRQRVAQGRQAPALMRDQIVDRVIVGRPGGPRAVDEQRFVEGRLVRAGVVHAEILLHQGQQAGDPGGRHARAGFIAELRRAKLVVRVRHVGEGGGPRRNHIRTRRDEVRLQAARGAFQPHAHVAAAGGVQDLIIAVRVRHRERVVRGDDQPELFQRPHGDDVLGRGRREDGVRRAPQPAAVAAADVAGGEHMGHRLVVRARRIGVAHRLIINRRVNVVGRDGIAPTVVHDVDVRSRGGIRDEELVGIVGEPALEQGHRVKHRARSHAAVAGSRDGAVRSGRSGAVNPRDDGAHESLMTIHIRGGAVAIHIRPARERRMGEFQPGADDAHRGPKPRQVEPVARRGRRGCVRGNPEPHAGQIVEEHRLLIRLNVLHRCHLRQRHQAVRRRHDGDDMAEREPLLALDLRAHRTQICQRLFLRPRKHHEIHPAAGGDGLLPDREGQQLHVQFVEGLEGQHALHMRRPLELLRHRRARPHEIGVVGHVADEFRPGPAQHGAEAIIHRPARLHHIAARVGLGAEMFRDVQPQRLQRLHQGIAQQHRRLAAEQFRVRLAGVADAKGKLRIFAQRVHLGTGGGSGGRGGRRGGGEDRLLVGEPVPQADAGGLALLDGRGQLAQPALLPLAQHQRGCSQKQQADQKPVSVFHTHYRHGGLTLVH